MLFAFVVLLSALAIEGLGTIISIIGLSSMLFHSPVVIAMAIVLDIGKVLAVSVVYRYWKDLGKMLKIVLLSASVVLVLITSAGVFGYLTGQFQKAISSSEKQDVRISALETEQERLRTRKAEIDKQIAQLPPSYVSSRVKLQNSFAGEINKINERLFEIDSQLPELKIQNINVSVEIGPIVYVAEMFKIPAEQAAKYVIIMITFVFDPLAIALLLAANFLFTKREPAPTKIVPPPAAPKTDVPGGIVIGSPLLFKDAKLTKPVSAQSTLAEEQKLDEQSRQKSD